MWLIWRYGQNGLFDPNIQGLVAPKGRTYPRAIKYTIEPSDREPYELPTLQT